MDRETLKTLQAPLKQQYQTNPESAVVQMRVTGTIDLQNPGCLVTIPPNNGREIVAGLHPAAGGDGARACSGDLLLQSLLTCAGTTLAVVATAMGIEIRSAHLEAIGRMDFRGTLGVDRETPVGLTDIEVRFSIDSSASPEQLDKLVQLTDRYCVVYQTLLKGCPITSVRA